MSESVRFTRHDDGRVTVDSEWPDEMLVSYELLRDANPIFLRSEGFRRFSINCANGWAIYRALRKGRYPNTFHVRRVRGTL